MITHADISNSPNKITPLCGKRGTGKAYYIWQDIGMIELDGRVSAEVDCEFCQMTGRLRGRGYSLTKSQSMARRRDDAYPTTNEE